MYCDKREHLVGKIILDNYLLIKKLEENWLINKEYIIKLIRKIIYIIDKIGKKIR